jgi:cell fate (sporulation/competence/biofilm development) regulator YlbF (YheA/YmcA/DUF963 family)
MSAQKKVTVIEPTAPPAPTESDRVLAMIDRMLAFPDVPVERYQQMFDLHRQVRADLARQKYFAAFAELQTDLPVVARKGTGHGTVRFARFEDIMEAIRPKLTQHGFSVSFRTEQPDGKLSVTCILAHEDGHSESTTMTLPHDTSGGKNAVQAWGSSASYGKRYTLITLLGIATDEDDDGRAGGGDTISEDQVDELFDLIAETQANVGQFLIVAKVGSAETPETIDEIKERLGLIKTREFDRLRAMLLKKKGAGHARA